MGDIERGDPPGRDGGGSAAVEGNQPAADGEDARHSGTASVEDVAQPDAAGGMAGEGDPGQ